MTARDDYPTLGWHAINHDRTNLGEQLKSALDEIDELRRDINAHESEAEFLRGRVTALSAQLGEYEDGLIVRDEAGKPLDIGALVEANAHERHLGRLMFLAQQRWQAMAEDLWEYIQEWHIESCSMHWINGAGMHPECSCHRIMAAKWDEITNAADYADDGVDA